jgi:hypothetical protein
MGAFKTSQYHYSFYNSFSFTLARIIFGFSVCLPTPGKIVWADGKLGQQGGNFPAGVPDDFSVNR